MAKPWTVDDSSSLYAIKGWGLKYFSVNDAGNVAVHPRRETGKSIDMRRLIDDVTARGIKMPVLFRFQDILRHRVETLNSTFRKVIQDRKYKGQYFGVYPIKVNQLREVVEEILDAGEPFKFGLEAGSKSELMAVLAMNPPDHLTIVNGYKDDSMMRLALIGVKLGKKLVVVIEKPSELPLLIKVSRELGVRPLIGLRAKLQTQGTGKWKTSAGSGAKFGLTSTELLEALRILDKEGMADCMRLLHFHIGSQITDIRTIKDAVKEAARLFAKLRKKGLKELEYLDCGGGLGVDYDGTHTTVDSSMNYSVREYVSDLVSTIQEVCKQERVPEPHIVTESGRATVAHHSLLVVNVFGSIEQGDDADLGESEDESDVVKGMRELITRVDAKDLPAFYHDGVSKRDEAFQMFRLGFLSLEDHAKIEGLFSRLCLELVKLAPKAKFLPEELQDLAKGLSDQYLCNFSLFQSLPDSWAIGQLFPIMPLQRLAEEPTRRTRLVDITCDSDGKISQFACHRKAGGLLPLHELRPGEPYYLGIFLMGAYQATMGDIHNLFGRVHEVHVFEDEEAPGGYYLEEILPGQTVKDVLATIQYSDFDLVKSVKASIDAKVKDGELKPREGVDLLNAYEAVMAEYTYLDPGTQSSAQVQHASTSAGK